MVNGNFGSVPVVDDEMRLIGIVSEYDLLDALLTGVDVTHLSAEEIMKHPTPSRPTARPWKSGGLSNKIT